MSKPWREQYADLLRGWQPYHHPCWRKRAYARAQILTEVYWYAINMQLNEARKDPVWDSFNDRLAGYELVD